MFEVRLKVQKVKQRSRVAAVDLSTAAATCRLETFETCYNRCGVARSCVHWLAGPKKRKDNYITATISIAESKLTFHHSIEPEQPYR